MGDVVTVWVREVDEGKKRISLTMKGPLGKAQGGSEGGHSHPKEDQKDPGSDLFGEVPHHGMVGVIDGLVRLLPLPADPNSHPELVSLRLG